MWTLARNVPEPLKRFGLGAEPVFSAADRKWYARRPVDDAWMEHPDRMPTGVGGVGLGDLTDSGLQSLAQTLQSYLTTNGSVTTSFSQCSDFQTAYNGQASSANVATIAVDGQYGPCTQQALQNVWNTAVSGGSGPAQQAPQTGFGGTCDNGSYVAPAAGTTSLPTEVVTASPPGSFNPAIAVLIGAGVFGAGLVSWALLSKKKGGRRRYRVVSPRKRR